MSHKEQIDRKLDYLHRNKVAYKAFLKMIFLLKFLSGDIFLKRVLLIALICLEVNLRLQLISL